MNWDRFAWERLVQASDLPFGPRALLMHLAVFADTSGTCRPSAETLARVSGAEVRAIANWLKALRETGWINSRRTGRANSYLLTVPSKGRAIRTKCISDEHQMPNGVLADPHQMPNGSAPDADQIGTTFGSDLHHVHPNIPRTTQRTTQGTSGADAPAPPPSLSEEQGQQPTATPQPRAASEEADSGSAQGRVGRRRGLTFEAIFDGTLPPSPEPTTPAPGPQLRDITPELAAAYLRGEAASPLASAPPPSEPRGASRRPSSSVPEVVPVPARRAITEHKL